MIRARLDRFFNISARNSSIQTEVLAGCSTFLALSYILIANPAILSQGGMSRNSVLFATILASGLATLAMGLWANLPFAVAPGMEMNAYVAFFVVGSLGFNWQQALGAVFWSGVLCVVLSGTGVRQQIIEALPLPIKSGLSLCVGVFLALVALKVAGLLVYQGVSIRGLGRFRSPDAYAFYVSLVLLLLLDRLRVRGAVLISIIMAALLCPLLGVAQASQPVRNDPSSMFASVGRLDLSVLIHPKMLSVILILFVLDFYGSIAKFIGLTMNTNIMQEGKLPGMKEGLTIDGAGTMAGAMLGTTSLITYVESAVGIGLGGRTGLTALVCGLLMLSCFLAMPLIRLVPVVATTGTLLVIAFRLCPSLESMHGYSRLDKMALAAMLLMIVATFAIDRAMLTGFLLYTLAGWLSGQPPNRYLVVSTVLLAASALLQIV